MYPLRPSAQVADTEGFSHREALTTLFSRLYVDLMTRLYGEN